MGTEYPKIDKGLESWISRQQMFFVATAPLASDGHVNCSPKGLDTLRVLDSQTLAYIDLGGSGIETVAHLRENGRVTIMFCAFDGPPKIFRFYGHGRAVQPGHEEFDDLIGRFPKQPTVRNIIVVDVDRIMDSCGFGVPEFEFRKQRKSLVNWLRWKSDEELQGIRQEQNARSLDGLPGLDFRD